MKNWLTNATRKDAAPPLAWALGATAIASVFAIVIMIVDYGPLNRPGAADAVRAELPAARYDAIKALIKAADQTCPRVCAVTPSPSLSGATRLDVACAPQSRPGDCAAPVHYTVAVTASE